MGHSQRDLAALLARPVAHVGYTESDDDYQRTVDAERYLRNAFDADEADLFAKADNVALDEGRDFLAERRTYGVVILHHLFQHPGEARSGVFGTSPLHAADAWRTRLAESGARYVFAYGGSTEVSAGYLDEIPGYRLEVYDADKAVYARVADGGAGR